MSYEDEKKEREEIRRKIKEKKEKRDNAKEKIKKLESKNKELSGKIEAAKDNIKWFQNKEKYIKVMEKIKLSQAELDKALKDLETAYSSYKKNFQGTSATAMNPKFNGARNEIIKIKNELTSIWNAASAGKRACEDMIKKNNRKIGKTTHSMADCNKVIKGFQSEIKENNQDIRWNKDKVNKYDKEISHLQHKL